jgi:hypothetical protein
MAKAKNVYALRNDEGQYFFMFHDLSDGDTDVDFSGNVAHADFFSSKKAAEEERKDLKGYNLKVVKFELKEV